MSVSELYLSSVYSCGKHFANEYGSVVFSPYGRAVLVYVSERVKLCGAFSYEPDEDVIHVDGRATPFGSITFVPHGKNLKLRLVATTYVEEQLFVNHTPERVPDVVAAAPAAQI